MTALVGEAQKDGGYGATSFIDYTSTAGNALVLFCASNGANTITDTAGNVWTLAGDTATAGATSQRVGQVYYCLNAAAITRVNLARASSSNWSLKITEWSGLATFGAAGVGNAPTVPSVAATTGGLILAGAFYFSGSPTTTAGYTPLANTGLRPNFNIATHYKVPTADETATPTFGITSAGLFAMTMAAAAPAAPQKYFRLTAAGWVPCEVTILREA